MSKMITISDDVYEELKGMKGDRSFSEVIRSLIRRKSNINVLMIGFRTRNEDEIEELRRELKEAEEWMQSLTQAL